jgi:hypothetical protein
MNDATMAKSLGGKITAAANPADVARRIFGGFGVKHDSREIARALEVLTRPGDVYELRIPKTREGTVSGYFNNLPAALKAIESLNGSGPGIYVTLNLVEPALLARAANRFRTRADKTTSDRDITRLRFLLGDVDPIRPSDISASEAELGAALDRCRTMRFELSELGLPAPIFGCSGNGGHLIWAIYLPNDAESERLLQRVLKALAARFDDEVIHIDQTVYNASRIIKLYGTIAAKGDNIPERPHRLAHLIDVPTKIEIVPRELLEMLAATWKEPDPPRPGASAGRSLFDIEAFIARYLKARAPVAYEGGRKWVLEECCFNAEHKAPDASIFQLADGSFGFKCLHNSCAAKHWHDVRELFEGPRPSSAYGQTSQTGARAEDSWLEPEPLGGTLPPVLAFDEQYLPAALRPVARDTAERMQVPIDLPAAALVCCLAGVVNRRAVVQPKDNDPSWTVTPNLWGATVASSGFLKTPTLQAIMQPLNAIQADWRRAHADRMKEYARAREEFDLRLTAWKEAFKAATKAERNPPVRPADEPEEPKLRRLIVNDATFEALHQTMADNPAGILAVRDELPGWWQELDKPGREGERAFCLQAWNGDTGHTIDRIGRGTIHVPACCMSFIGGIQPARLRSYLAEALKDGPGNDGLIQRFQVMVWPDSERTWRRINRPADQDAQRRAERIFRRLVELDAEKSARFFFDPDGQELFWEWLEELETKVRGDELHPALISHLSKYRSLMPSLALLFCLADLADLPGEGALRISPNAAEDKLRIPLENVRQAAAMCEYLESHARRIYSSLLTPQMRAAHELAARIRRREIGANGAFSCREVYRKGWAGLDSPELAERATEVLQDASWIRPVATESKPAGGRAATRFAVNPKVWREV